ncbi:MAG TPA: hypothetical protein VJ488_03025 [Dehalococcoidia bacterium]|nr:hypothetical protein [Dehalococcoidia bacterium]
MGWEFFIAVIVAIPVIVIPAVLVWYLNVNGISHFIRESRRRRVASLQNAESSVDINEKA